MGADAVEWKQVISSHLLVRIRVSMPRGLGDKITLTQTTVPFTSVGIVGSPNLIHDLVSIDSVWVLSNGQVLTTAVTLNQGSLVWASPPPAGSQYTIHGRKHPSYSVYTDLPRDRAHFGGLSLPRLVILRVLDLDDRLQS